MQKNLNDATCLGELSEVFALKDAIKGNKNNKK